MTLLEHLTVYVISTGEDTYDECLEALQNQDCAFRVEHIRDVYPMSRAFQAMPDRCQTKYFVQVDADMVLHPHAIRSLYEAICHSGFRTYMVLGPLYEEGFGIGGRVKCWKRSIFRLFRFRDVRTVDRDFFRRARWLGFKRHELPDVLGVHKPRHSPFSCFLKSKCDVEKWRFLGRPARLYATGVLEEALQEYPENWYRLLGTLLGVLTGKERVIRSKDIRLEAERYRQVLSLLGRDEQFSPPAPFPQDWTDWMRGFFVMCYADLKGKRTQTRRYLARMILEIYSGSPPGEDLVGEFLEVVEA